MRASRFLMMAVVVTMIALVYVSQQTALLRLSYDIKEKERSCSELLDRDKILLYNVRQLESPARLERVLLAKNMKFEVPSRERVILVSAISERQNKTKATAGIFVWARQAANNLFTFGPEAQARTVK